MERNDVSYKVCVYHFFPTVIITFEVLVAARGQKGTKNLSFRAKRYSQMLQAKKKGHGWH